MKTENRYLDCKQITENYPFSMAMVRRLAAMRKYNGLDNAVLKIKRKILFNKERFESWLETHAENSKKEGAR